MALAKKSIEVRNIITFIAVGVNMAISHSFITIVIKNNTKPVFMQVVAAFFRCRALQKDIRQTLVANQIMVAIIFANNEISMI